jgi:tRNA nucleotidyltransferase/poly(A) polymerase
MEHMLNLLLKSPPLRKAHTIAKQHKQDLFLVGGTIRDLYLNGSPGTDFDFLVHDNVQTIADLFAQSYGGTFFCLDGKRGIYRAIINAADDLKTADFATSYEGNLTRDLINRDFTINSIALNLTDIFENNTLTLIDPARGLDDIQKRYIRVTSPTSFNHDPVRILRAVRLSRTCNCTLVPQTEKHIKDQKKLLLTSPWERIRNEFFMILNTTAGTSSSLEELDQLGLLFLLIPELEKMKGIEQGIHHDYTLWEHSLKTAHWTEVILNDLERFLPRHAPALTNYFTEQLEDDITRRSLLTFTALLHDMGKPATKTSSNGTAHFFHHDLLGMKINQGIAKRFKLSKKTSRIITMVTRHHMRPLNLHQLKKISERAQFRLLRDLDGAVLETLIVACADALATRAPSPVTSDTIPPLLKTVSILMDYYFQETSHGTIRPLLNGNEIMEALHLEPGKEVGELVELIKAAEREGRISTKEEARALIAAEHAHAVSLREKGELGDT